MGKSMLFFMMSIGKMIT